MENSLVVLHLVLSVLRFTPLVSSNFFLYIESQRSRFFYIKTGDGNLKKNIAPLLLLHPKLHFYSPYQSLISTVNIKYRFFFYGMITFMYMSVGGKVKGERLAAKNIIYIVFMQA